MNMSVCGTSLFFVFYFDKHSRGKLLYILSLSDCFYADFINHLFTHGAVSPVDAAASPLVADPDAAAVAFLMSL